jgi:hypothetical protein
VTTTNVFASFANVSGRGLFGTVGIGIANPFGQLEVSSPLPSTTVTVSMTDATTGTGFGAALVKDTTQNFSVVNYQAADLLLGTNLTTRMRLYSAGGQSILGPVAISAGSLSSPSLTGANLQVTGNVYASNALSVGVSLQAPLANIGTLNVGVISNLNSLTLGSTLSVPTANVTTLNVSSLVAGVANVDTLNVGVISNLNSLTLGSTFSVPTANVSTLNVWQISNLQGLTIGSNLSVPTANVGTLNVLTISNLNSLTTNVVSTFANVGTLNVWQISNLQNLSVLSTLSAPTANIETLNVYQISNLQNLTLGSTLAVPTANVSTLNVIAISNLNSLTTNVVSAFANVGTLNVWQISNLQNLSVLSTLSAPTANIETLNVYQISNLQNLTLGSTLAVPTANVSTLNVIAISNLNSLTTNVVSTFANVGTLNVWQISNLQGLTVLSNLSTPTANVGTLNVIAISNLNSLTTNVVSTFANIGTLNVWQISNLQGLTLGSTLSVPTANVGTLNVLAISNLNSLTTNVVSTFANVGTMNVWQISNLQGLTLGSTLSVPTANVSTLNVIAISNLNSLSLANLNVSFTANLANLFVTTANVSNLYVTSNILPGVAGNTYVVGNVVVSGNIFSALGSPLGAGGGYYFSLPSDIALQPSYTGPVGTARPLSVGLSNGFTINGTSTFITVTSNGNFRFSQAGPYVLSAVFAGSDNLLGLAVGSNVADIHGTDQGYLYRYTTFVSQNPTELIEIPINVTDATKYYYLDIFAVDGGQLRATANTSGGTYLTITPLTGGGLATGGPGGTPGTQWITSGSNIYFPNSVGIGAVNPAYNLDVSTGTAAAQILVTSNISSLGLYGPTLNIASNVLIQSNLAVGGGVASAPPYALYVTGQGYFSEHVSYDNFAGYRNRLINGTFRVAYRANTLTISNTSSFSLSNSWVMDRWHIDVGNLSTSNVSLTIKQDSPVGTNNGFSNIANVYVTRAFGSTLDNTWICPLVQTIESSGTYDLRFGQSTAKPMVMTFYANVAVAGNYSVVLRSKADNTYFANLVTLTNSWNRYTVYVPPCTIGTWGAGTAGSVEVCLLGVSFGSGRANVAPTTNWTASPGYAPVACTGAVNWMASAPSRIQVTGVQLEPGTISTPFEIRLLSETVRFCQRYYESNPDIQYSAALGSGRINSTPYVVTKREHANVTVFRDLSNLTANTNVSQFVAYYGDGTLKGTQAINSYLSSDYGFSFNFTNTGSKFMDGSIMEAQFVWQADAEIY